MLPFPADHPCDRRRIDGSIMKLFPQRGEVSVLTSYARAVVRFAELLRGQLRALLPWWSAVLIGAAAILMVVLIVRHKARRPAPPGGGRRARGGDRGAGVRPGAACAPRPRSSSARAWT